MVASSTVSNIDRPCVLGAIFPLVWNMTSKILNWIVLVFVHCVFPDSQETIESNNDCVAVVCRQWLPLMQPQCSKNSGTVGGTASFGCGGGSLHCIALIVCLIAGVQWEGPYFW